jgi:hypothetical protein
MSVIKSPKMHLLLALPYHYFRLWIAGPSIFAGMPSGSVQILCGTYLLEFVLLGTVPQPTLPCHNFRLCIAGLAILLVYPMANNKFFSQPLDD